MDFYFFSKVELSTKTPPARCGLEEEVDRCDYDFSNDSLSSIQFENCDDEEIAITEYVKNLDEKTITSSHKKTKKRSHTSKKCN